MAPKIHCCLIDETRMQGNTQNEKIKLLSVTLNTNLREKFETISPGARSSRPVAQIFGLLRDATAPPPLSKKLLPCLRD